MPKSWRYYILILVFLIGGVFETFKAWKQPQSENTRQLEAGELAQFDFTPYKANSNQEPKEKRRIMGRTKFKSNRLTLADVTFPRNHSFDESKKKDGKKGKKKKDDKKKEKTAKKKKEPKKVVEINEPEVYDTDDEEDFKPETPENNDVAQDAFVPPVGAPIGPTVANNNPQSFEVWAALLLGQPDYKKLTEFISLFQKGEITKEVFYQILAAMLEDSREDMNDQAIRALGGTPTPESFVMLSDVASNSTFRANIRTLARRQLNQYTSSQYLNVLRQVILTDATDFAATVAADYLRKSAERNLESSNQASNGNDVEGQGADGQTPQPGQGSDQTRVPAQQTALIQEYVSIAETLRSILSHSPQNKDFAAAAERAIQLIEQLTT